MCTHGQQLYKADIYCALLHGLSQCSIAISHAQIIVGEILSLTVVEGFSSKI